MVRERMPLRSVVLFLICVVVSDNSTYADVLSYSFTSGGTIDGLLNSVAFTGAGVTLTADADNALFSIGDANGIPYRFQPVVATMKVDGFSQFQVTQPGFGIVDFDVSAIHPGRTQVGFGFFRSGVFEGFLVFGPTTGDVLNGGSAYGSFIFSASSYSTTVGPLVVGGGASTYTATFNSGSTSTVPEPCGWLVCALLAIAVSLQRRWIRLIKWARMCALVPRHAASG